MSSNRARAWGQLALGGVLLLALWVLLVWVGSRPGLKVLFDLTPQQVNSLDPATVELVRDLRALEAEIEFHLFYPPYTGQGGDEQQQQQRAIRDRVRNLTGLLLLRYQYEGGDAVEVTAHDFYGDATKTRESAQAFGYTANDDDTVVVAVSMPGKARRFRKLSSLLDLAVIERPSAVGPMSRASMPVLKKYVGEEQLSSAIKSLLVEGTPVAYVLRDSSPHTQYSEAAGSFSYSMFVESLARSGFEVRQWEARQQPAVPPDATLVIALEPTSDFTDGVTAALFEFVKRGGGVFVNYAWSHLEGSNPDGGRFGELLGYSLSEQPVLHMIPDRSGRTTTGLIDNNPGVRKLQLAVNYQHPTTRRIAEAGRPLEVADARELRVRAGAPPAIRREELLRTGPEGWLGTIDSGGEPDYTAPQVGRRPYTVGMAFELDVAEAANGDTAPAAATKVGRVVVVSGRFCNNAGMPLFGDFALNICNWMAERRVLLDLKAPGYEAKYLSLQPQQLDRVHTFVFWGVPGFFLALGVVVFVIRRRQ